MMINITGKSMYTAEQLNKFLLRYNKTPKINGMGTLEFCKLYIEEGAAEGIRGDIAFCQAVKETGWFKYGGQVLPEQNNYCGLGALNQTIGQKGKGAWFKTQREGVRAQIQHLKAYANKEALKNSCVDPRFRYVERGIAPSVTDLNGKWAIPGIGYGEDIIRLFNLIKTD